MSPLSSFPMAVPLGVCGPRAARPDPGDRPARSTGRSVRPTGPLEWSGPHDGTLRMIPGGLRGRLGKHSVRRDHHDRRDDTPRRHDQLGGAGPQPLQGLRGRPRRGAGALRRGVARRLAGPGRDHAERPRPPLRHLGARIGPDGRAAGPPPAVDHRPGRRGRVRGTTGQPARRRPGRGATGGRRAGRLPGRRSPAAAVDRHAGDPVALRPHGGDHPGDAIRRHPRGGVRRAGP